MFLGRLGVLVLLKMVPIVAVMVIIWLTSLGAIAMKDYSNED